MTRDELASEVVAEVRGILARLKAMAKNPGAILRYPPADHGDDMVDAAALAAHAMMGAATAAGATRDPLQAFLANPPPIPAITEMRRRMRERQAAEPLATGPAEVSFGGQSIGTAENVRVNRWTGQGANPSDMSDPANWSEGRAPAAGDEVQGGQFYFPESPPPPPSSLTVGYRPSISPGADIIPGPVIREAFSRLLALLELSPGEREFIQGIADANTTGGPAEAFPLLEIFGDWLEDQGRIGEAVRVRKVSPRHGDVLVLDHPREWTRSPMMMDEMREFARSLREKLEECGRQVVVVAMPNGGKLRIEDDAGMYVAGWVRVKEHKTRLQRLLHELDGGSDDPGTVPMEHMADAVLHMIQRLKRENAELARQRNAALDNCIALRQENTELKAEQERAFHASAPSPFG